MKSIRISDEAYEYLKYRANIDGRSMIRTLDRFIIMFREVENEELESKGISRKNR